MESTKDLFVFNLRRYRKAKFRSQDAFAQKVGLSERGYQKYEQGESEPTPEILDRFSKQLGIRPVDLITSESAQEPMHAIPGPLELKAIIESAGSDLPLLALIPVLKRFASEGPEVRAATLAVLYGERSIAAPYARRGKAQGQK